MIDQTAIHHRALPLENALQHHLRLDAVEAATTPAFAFTLRFAAGEHVPEHEHGRAQLLHPITGVVIVSTQMGRWMVPPDHALWIPAGVRHSVDMIGEVEMQSVYVQSDAMPGLPVHLHVTGLTPLMRSLSEEVVRQGPDNDEPRSRLIQALLLHEIPRLPERPLGLPLPAHPGLARLCRSFISAPSARLEIDEWAARTGMSRRTFTRVFRQETGLSLSAWRQQACVMAALPRLTAGDAVTVVALDLGYDSMPAFTTMFSRVMGAPPKAYLTNQKAA
ncbi:helix-turn-helix transcriptional regulator [Hoeflea sp. G2-23]|uniref:Helix-turn-helix transcriptional regulator n=1 Tax=Hoeflea algicola TaxID=2983763 RepID=A0ABT3Z5D3_9HYPH|nr:helix-turn-helix transcriptional regulator [Hoeflea algicola]MCY0146979.1 helix-turn-helix transcriptional regulator [Hoeflea algicola]